jgi:hypothetical protein
MARIRSIKPEFWGDRKLASQVSRDARLLYIALWNQADEWGRCQGDARWIKGHCLPYDDDLNLQAIDRLVDELAAAGRVVKYEVDSDPYLYLPKLADHQRLEPAKVPSRLPEPPTDPSVDAAPSESRANESAPRADEAETIGALHVAGGRLQVAGGRDVAPSTARKSDEIWDALLDACNVDTSAVTAASRGAYNRAVADLRAVGATPDDIRRRAANYRSTYPDAPMTPTALARRWAELGRAPTRDTRTQTAKQLDAAMQRALAAESDHRKALP